ncbi:MAG: prephenate dehydrogenase/arogenate dehydrogenase family protein [Acidimicrobiia bacterium]|nr:prephenate dehydrogenase/arogenate dehydrogenase family protein [Acidimicrobiia bacterium]
MTLRVGIAGTGLIGASIGAGLRAAGWDVSGWDPDPDALERAEGIGALDRSCETLDDLLSEDPDVVVLGAPPDAVIDLVAGLTTSALVTDVAGVKAPVIEAAGHLSRFVGGHPMAGRETGGAEHASPALFRGATWIVTLDGAADVDVELVEAMVHALGARAVRMTAADHDEAVALISHLPQVLAVTLLESAAETGHALDLASGSFRDLTRVAASDPSMWSQLLAANRSAVAARLRAFGQRLDSVADVISDSDSMQDRLREARDVRSTLSPPVVAVDVALADEPGELAKVGRALESSRADVRDLQLRHGRHGGGGVLTLSVRPGEAETLVAALSAVGLEVIA